MSGQDMLLLQRWMKDVITTPGGLPYKLQYATSEHSINELEVVRQNEIATVYERLNVYASGYVLRLLECLYADFPVLKRFMGEELFDTFAKASLMFGAPVSYTLYDLGKNFITFLEKTHPPGASEAMFDLPVEIARLERARQEAVRAVGTENDDAMPEPDVEQILFHAGDLIVSLPPCVRLLQQQFSLKNLFKTTGDTVTEIPEARTTYVAVSRKNYRITMEELTEWQFRFLSACEQPVSLSKAVELASASSGIPSGELMADLCVWLPVFFGNGFVVLR